MTEVKVHKNIHVALAAAQAEMGRAAKDTNNPHFKSKYADLASVMDACMGPLSKHGIAVTQPTTDDETGRYVQTILAHGESETQVECRVPLIVGKNDMQGYGSAVTYARRYGLMGMAGIAADDDDGNAAAAGGPQPVRQQPKPAPKPTFEQVVGKYVERLASIDNVAALNAAWDAVMGANPAICASKTFKDAFDARMAQLPGDEK